MVKIFYCISYKIWVLFPDLILQASLILVGKPTHSKGTSLRYPLALGANIILAFKILPVTNATAYLVHRIGSGLTQKY